MFNIEHITKAVSSFRVTRSYFDQKFKMAMLNIEYIGQAAWTDQSDKVPIWRKKIKDDTPNFLKN